MTYRIKDEKKTIDILYTIIMAHSLASCELTTSPAVTAQTTHEWNITAVTIYTAAKASRIYNGTVQCSTQTLWLSA